MVNREKQIELMMAAAERENSPLRGWLRAETTRDFMNRDLRSGPDNGGNCLKFEKVQMVAA